MLRVMASLTDALLADIDAYLAKNPGISETTFGRKAVNDGKLVPRLRRGRRVWPETEQAIRGFMDGHKFPAPSGEEAA
jgi:hypothetical protein